MRKARVVIVVVIGLSPGRVGGSSAAWAQATAPVPQVAKATKSAEKSAEKGSGAGADARSRASQAAELGRFDEAIALLQRGYQETGNPALLFDLAELHLKLGHRAEARRLFERYLGRAPDGPAKVTAARKLRTLEIEQYKMEATRGGARSESNKSPAPSASTVPSPEVRRDLAPRNAAPTSVTPANAAPASVTPANAAPTSAAPILAPASVAPASVAPASVPPASVAPASVAPASAARASAAPASAAPTSAARPSVAPPTFTPHLAAPSVAPSPTVKAASPPSRAAALPSEMPPGGPAQRPIVNVPPAAAPAPDMPVWGPPSPVHTPPARVPTLKASAAPEVASRQLLATSQVGDTAPGHALPRWVPWTGAGVTAALLTGAILTGLSASSRYDELRRTCGNTSAGCRASDIDGVRARALTANVLWISTAVVAVATGFAFYVAHEGTASKQSSF